MLNKGASDVFEDFHSYSLPEMSINLTLIEDYGRVKLTTIPPRQAQKWIGIMDLPVTLE